MEHKLTQISALADMTRTAAAITVLQCHTSDYIDGEPIEHLIATKGQPEAEEIICRVLEDIAYRLDSLQVAKDGHAFPSIAKPARRITHVAAQVGLVDVSRIASHVADAADNEDGVGLNATMSRLERAFDAAVTDIWQFRENRP